MRACGRRFAGSQRPLIWSTMRHGTPSSALLTSADNIYTK